MESVPTMIAPKDWTKFLEETENMTKPAVIKGGCEDHAEDYYRVSTHMFRGLADSKEVPAKFRLWLNGNLSEDNIWQIYNNAPNPEEDVIEWSKRVFEDKKFGIVANDCEKYSHELSELLAQYHKPLLDTTGYPINGINVTVFMGNYGFTPFGIHVDLLGENTMHIHLGPAPKKMYLWTAEKFAEAHGGKVPEGNQDPAEWLLESADVYHIEPGDLFYMPAHFYHIGHTAEISLGVSVWFSNPGKAQLATSLLNELRNESVDYDSRDVTHTKLDYAQNPDLIRGQLDSVYVLEDRFKNKTIFEVIDDKLVEHYTGLLSNAGVKQKLMDLDESDLEVNMSESIEIVFPFQIKERMTGEGAVTMFLRGHRITIPHYQKLSDLIAQLNQGEKIGLQFFYDSLSEEWSEDVITFILQEFKKHRVIRFISA